MLKNSDGSEIFLHHMKIKLISAGQLLQNSSPQKKIQSSVCTPEYATDSPDTLKETSIQISVGALSSQLYFWYWDI